MYDHLRSLPITLPKYCHTAPTFVSVFVRGMREIALDGKRSVWPAEIPSSLRHSKRHHASLPQITIGKSKRTEAKNLGFHISVPHTKREYFLTPIKYQVDSTTLRIAHIDKVSIQRRTNLQNSFSYIVVGPKRPEKGGLTSLPP